MKTNDSETDNRQSDTVRYGTYLRPRLEKLLRIVNLDISYTEAEGSWLSYYDKHGKKVRVLDAAQGYAANIFGHDCTILAECLNRSDEVDPTAFVQGSVRAKAALLGQKLHSIVAKETGIDDWVIHLSNSGTEAVEAGLKACLRHYYERTQQQIQTLREQYLKAELYARGPAKRNIFEKFLGEASVHLSGSGKPPWFVGNYPDLKTTLNFEQLGSLLCSLIADMAPTMVSFEGGFHGKTLGALGCTSNQAFREGFFSGPEWQNREFLPFNDREKLLEWAAHNSLIIPFPQLRGNILSLKTTLFFPVAGFIVEPIQGEAGIIPASDEFLTSLRRVADRFGCPLVFDEIQSGMYRTGWLFASSRGQVRADIYCLAKGLGGGFAKIGATIIKEQVYSAHFGFVHSSTFAEDDFSSTVALAVLNRLQSNQFHCVREEVAQFLLQELRALRQRYPQIVSNVRGSGHLLGLEFSEQYAQSTFEFKVLDDGGMYGYFLAAALLRNESLRIMPTLSNSRTLRISPALTMTLSEAKFLCKAVSNLLLALEQRNMAYLLGMFYPEELISLGTSHEPVRFENNGDKVPSVAFLTHFIDVDHLKSCISSQRNFPNELIVMKTERISPILEFGIYHKVRLANEKGRKIDFYLFGIPLLSETISSMKKSARENFVAKIQSAVDLAAANKIGTVGLGQFTSIVTKNGLLLDRRSLNLTTGNAYTVWLVVEALLKVSEERNLRLDRATLVCNGAAGNIVSICTALLADRFAKLLLIHHAKPEGSPVFLESLRRLFQDLIESKRSTPLVDAIKQAGNGKDLNDTTTILEILSTQGIERFIEPTCDQSRIKEGTVVVSGTNQTKPCIDSENLATGALVVDIGIPANVAETVDTTRPDVYVIDGGIAALPTLGGKVQSIGCPFIPLAPGESYACLAETLGIGFSGQTDIINIGSLTAAKVLEVKALVEGQGFRLARSKRGLLDRL